MKKILVTNSARHFGLPSGEIKIGRFPGGEVSLRIKEDIKNQDIYIVGSTNAPAENLVELLLTIDTARRLGVRNLTLIIPYFAYSRADREKFIGEAVSAATIAKLTEVLGGKNLKIYTLDIHSENIQSFFTVPFKNVSTSELFVDKFLNITDLTIVAPDEGASKRAKDLAARINVPYAVIEKERTEAGDVIIKSIKGNLTGKALIFDDIIDSGRTIIKASEFLKTRNVEEIYVAATHMVWQGGGAKLLSDSTLVSKIFTSDTIMPPSNIPAKIEIIQVAPILLKIING